MTTTMKVLKGKAEKDSQPLGGEPVAAFKPDDDQIAVELASEWKGNVSFFHSEWKVYNKDTGTWQGRNDAEMRRYIRKELRGWRARGVSVNQNRIKSLQSMLEDDLYIPDRSIMAQQDEQKRYVNLRNGLFNLETMALEDHRRDIYFTNQLDFNYDPDATCPTLHRYLQSSLVYPGTHERDRLLYILTMQALGYSMTARTDLKASFWLVGEKDSGKSTFISMIKGIMGSLHGTLDLTQLGTNRFLLSGIVGKRVITFTEASGNSYLPDALYKTITGGSDEIYADVKNRDAIAFRPQAKLWWAMNEMPRITDRSGATTRRIYIIPFNRTIPAHERIEGLEGRLMAERSGIFNEMIRWYKRLVAGGDFERCEQTEEQRRRYIAENDTEATYIEERTERHESYWTQSSLLYTDYSLWCQQYGFRPKNFNQIASEWRRLGFTDTKSHGVTIWNGLKLRDVKKS